MSAYYQSRTGFRLFESSDVPSWRPPQLGAIGALISHWTLDPAEPALVAIPTGVGKTAIAMAAPHVLSARRTLVIVPSADLRRQMAARFSQQTDLLKIGALSAAPDAHRPIVRQVTGRLEDWLSLKDADVVIGLPQSLSPAHYESPPPADLFDLFICDEAHHLPAPTWRSILDHFSVRWSLLLTATPRRRDGKKIPGKTVFHYPLRRALAESLYQPVRPRILDLQAHPDQDRIDQQIADEVQRVLAQPEHATSSLLIRARKKQRARQLAALYEAHGLAVAELHSGLPSAEQARIIGELRDGTIRAVAVVGMLVEGFDLPRLRIAAYHDKHKSLPATAQLIGRLARVDPEYPQDSVLVTVRDIDVYPALEGQVRRLYEEDSDWARILPGILDAEIEEAVADQDYARRYEPPSPSFAIEAIYPLRRAIVYEAPPGWRPAFAQQVPPELAEGLLLGGQAVVYAGLNAPQDTLMVLTAFTRRPRWYDDPGLDAPIYDLHLASIRRSPRTDKPDLFFINSGNVAVARGLKSALDPAGELRLGDPQTLQAALDSLPRVAASNVGMRGRYAAVRGTPSYRMYAGSDIERGLRDSDTAQSSLGHAMIQVAEGGPAFTAGLSTGKAKYWETRYTALRQYDEFVTSLAERYWTPPAPPAGPLLPGVDRGVRLTAWPDETPVVVELDPGHVGGGWTVVAEGQPISLETLEFRVERLGPERVRITAELPREEGNLQLWSGWQSLTGDVTSENEDLPARRGFSYSVGLSTLLTERPLTIYYLNGAVVHGAELYDSHGVRGPLMADLQAHPWHDTDLRAETRTAAEARGLGRSIDEVLEDHLRKRSTSAKRRWILGNDGPGEIADYLVIHLNLERQVSIELWHAKAAGGDAPSVRVTDFEIAVAQAIKSRRWVTDRRLWEELGARLAGERRPHVTVIEGNDRLLSALCGRTQHLQSTSFAARPPSMRAEIWIAQPGLSRTRLNNELAAATPSLLAQQVHQILTVLHDGTRSVAQRVGVLCSP